ncbi:MAG: hypothetical protein C0404_08305 [Verrucomicrobia bacterium]|nr:hypothetical protein [Verrucomicrobiota bacterium]
MKRKSAKLDLMSVPRYLRCAALGIENVLETGKREYKLARFHSYPHAHNSRTMEICYLARGQICDCVAGRRYTMTGGNVLVVFPNDRHGERRYPDQKGTLYWVKLDLPPVNTDSFLNLRGTPAKGLLALLWNLKPRYFRGSPLLASHLDAIIHLLDTCPEDPTTPAMISWRVYSFIMEVVSCAEQHSRGFKPLWIDNVIRYIDLHLSDSIRVKDMAAISGLTPGWFKKAFRNALGMPPMEYAMRRRTSRARQMLRWNPEKSITDIAMALGFSSSQSFATSFKRYCGNSPSSFRKHAWDRDTDGKP